MSIGLCLQARTEFTYSRSANPFLAPPPNLKACTQCGTTRTPQWREGPEGASSWLLEATGHLPYRFQYDVSPDHCSSRALWWGWSGFIVMSVAG